MPDPRQEAVSLRPSGIWISIIPALSRDHLEAEAIALMERFTVEFLNVGLFTLVHVGEVARVETFIHLRDGAVDMVTKVHHFFLQTHRLILSLQLLLLLGHIAVLCM